MSSYTVYVAPEALAAAKRLPGHIRQRVKRAFDGLTTEPRPPESKALDIPETAQAPEREIEVRRLRLDKWRVLYVILEAEKVVDVLAIRKRPPYDYGDLRELLGDEGESEPPAEPS